MKKAWIFFVVFVLISSANVWAQQTQDDQARIQADLKRICSQMFCRPPVDFKLQKGDGTIFEHNTGASLPIVQGGMVTVYPGETVYVEADQGTDALQNLWAVKKFLDSAKTLVMEFKQHKNEKDGRWYMFFKITNPFSKPIKYHAQMMLLDEKIYKTSSCPIPTGGSGYESWPEPIFQLILTDFRFVSEKDTACEY